MRVLLCLAVMLVLVGCAAQPQEAGDPAAPVRPPVVEEDTGPVGDPSLERVDASGHTPEEAVTAVVDALNRQDWEAAYGLYAQPYVDYAQALKDWTASPESYEDFVVLETRVERQDLAFVLVRYASRSGEQVTPEWWAVDKVEGLWKTRWMPVQ